jgi:hypothetical protein
MDRLMKLLTTLDVALLAARRMLGRTLWAGAVVVFVMLFDARAAFAAKLMAAAAVLLWMAKAGIPKSARAAGYARLSAGDKARLIAAGL